MDAGFEILGQHRPALDREAGSGSGFELLQSASQLVYIDPDSIEVVAAAFDAAVLAQKNDLSHIDLYGVERELSIGASRISAEREFDPGTLTLGVDILPLRRAYFLAVHLARDVTPIRVVDLTQKARSQDCRDLLTLLRPLSVAGYVRRAVDITDCGLILRDRETRASVSVVTPSPHGLFWSQALFRNRLFALGLASNIAPNEIQIQAAALMF